MVVMSINGSTIHSMVPGLTTVVQVSKDKEIRLVKNSEGPILEMPEWFVYEMLDPKPDSFYNGKKCL